MKQLSYMLLTSTLLLTGCTSVNSPIVDSDLPKYRGLPDARLVEYWRAQSFEMQYISSPKGERCQGNECNVDIHRFKLFE